MSVITVEVGARSWTGSFKESLAAADLGTVGYRLPAGAGAEPSAALPWANLNQVTVKFTGPVEVQAKDLLVAGARVANYAVARMAYDAASFTATWTLGRAVASDKLLLRLRTSDGVFQSRVDILPGDVNQSGGAVNAADLRTVRTRQSGPTGIPGTPDPGSGTALRVLCDVDGNGVVDAADVVAVRGRLSTRLPERDPQVALPAMPTSDRWYGTVINATHNIVSPSYLPRLSPKLSIVTDLIGSTSRTWLLALARLRAAHPQMLIGTYHSARDAQAAGSFTSYPQRAVPREGLTAEQLLMQHPHDPHVAIVDYSQPAARKYLVEHIVRDVVRTGRPLAFLDSVSHHETGFPMPWATTMDYLREVSSQLHDLGKRVMINAAWVPGWTTEQSVDQFIASGIDGVSLENPFASTVRNNAGRTRTAMAQYRRLLDAGVTVAFAPVSSTAQDHETEQRTLAAFGMMFRKPGDRLFVTQNFWRDSPDWTEWPEKFGAAVGDATIWANAQGQVVMTRHFRNHSLTLNTATRQVTVARRAAAPEAADEQSPLPAA